MPDDRWNIQEALQPHKVNSKRSKMSKAQKSMEPQTLRPMLITEHEEMFDEAGNYIPKDQRGKTRVVQKGNTYEYYRPR